MVIYMNDAGLDEFEQFAKPTAAGAESFAAAPAAPAAPAAAPTAAAEHAVHL